MIFPLFLFLFFLHSVHGLDEDLSASQVDKLHDLFVKSGVFPHESNCTEVVALTRSFLVLIKKKVEEEGDFEALLREKKKEAFDRLFGLFPKDLYDEDEEVYGRAKTILQIFVDKIFSFSVESDNVCGFVNDVVKNSFRVKDDEKTFYMKVVGDQFTATINKVYKEDEDSNGDNVVFHRGGEL